FGRDALLGHIASSIIHLENLNRLLPDIGKFGADAAERHLLVHCVFGQVEGMRGTVVAIHAIHHAMFSFVQLLLGGLRIGGNKFNGLAAIVGVRNNRDRRPLVVGGNVADAGLVGEVVPVDADRALPRYTAHFEQQHVGLRRVFFVVLVAGIHQELISRKA